MKRYYQYTLAGLLLLSTTVFADVQHCDATYMGKPFVQATIWSDVDGYGPLECDYKNPGDKSVIAFKYPAADDYYPVRGYWRSTMPGYQWCTVDDNNQFDTCLFAKREKHHR